MRTIRVLHVFSRMDRGGAEMRTLDIMRRLDRRQFQLEFCCTSGDEGELADDIRQLGGQVHIVRQNAEFGSRFAQLLREGRFDVVHSHLLYTSGVMLNVAARCKVPVRVAHFRNTEQEGRNTPRYKLQRWLFKRLIDRHATNILSVSGATMSSVWRPDWQKESRCKVIYNGLDLVPFQAPFDRAQICRELGVSDTDPIYLHVGNMRPQKNHERLLSIFIAIAAQEDKAQFVMAGKGGNDIEAKLREAAARAGIADRVKFAGVRQDVPDLMRTADAFIFPSLWEGLPGAVLEACAAGTPVLASNLTVMQEMTPHLRGLKALSLEEPDEKWADVARTLREQWSAPAARETLSVEFAKGPFNLDRCVREHCEVWSGS